MTSATVSRLGLSALAMLATKSEPEGVQPVAPPKGLSAELRAYQRDGLNWLGFLREYGFGGVLADDMGLGKTVQTLAWLQAEKEAGRLDRPALVVAPTSLMVNWRREAQQFTPALKVLTLHGAAPRGFRAHRGPRPGAHHLRADPARCRDADGAEIPCRNPRRGAGDQESQSQGHADRARPRRAPAAVPHRHADGEPPG